MAGKIQPTGLEIGMWYISLVYRVHSNLENELLIVFFFHLDCFPDQEAEKLWFLYDFEDVTQNDMLLLAPYAWFRWL